MVTHLITKVAPPLTKMVKGKGGWQVACGAIRPSWGVWRKSQSGWQVDSAAFGSNWNGTSIPEEVTCKRCLASPRLRVPHPHQKETP